MQAIQSEPRVEHALSKNVEDHAEVEGQRKGYEDLVRGLATRELRDELAAASNRRSDRAKLNLRVAQLGR